MQQPRKAFTLVELLTVVAIIAILAAILLPVVGNIKQKAAMAKCASTLRNLHSTAMMMAQDNRGKLPMSRNNNDDSATHWPVMMLKYLDLTTQDEFKEQLACPAYEGNERGTFWMLGYAYNETPAYLGDSSGVKGGASKKALMRERTYMLSEVTHKPNRVMFCDSNQWHIGENVDFNEHVDADRHGGGLANAVFFDGHIEQLTPEEIELSVTDPQRYILDKRKLQGGEG